MERRKIMNIFEWEEDETRLTNGTIKDGTNDQDQHINPFANTPGADSIVSYMLTRVIIFYHLYHIFVTDSAILLE
jgi:hypothetical protein